MKAARTDKTKRGSHRNAVEIIVVLRGAVYASRMADNSLLRWTLEAKKALQQAEQLSSHASSLVRDSAASVDRADAVVPKCVFLKDALRAQVVLLDHLAAGCYAVEENARREFEVLCSVHMR
jgi:hypothetical protein